MKNWELAEFGSLDRAISREAFLAQDVFHPPNNLTGAYPFVIGQAPHDSRLLGMFIKFWRATAGVNDERYIVADNDFIQGGGNQSARVNNKRVGDMGDAGDNFQPFRLPCYYRQLDTILNAHQMAQSARPS